MKIKTWSLIQYILLLIAGGALLFWAFRGMDVNKIIHDVFQANMFWVFMSALLSIAAFISRAYRWKLLIEPLGYSPALSKTTYSLMVGYLANFAFPRLGEVSRCGALTKAESIPFNKLLGTVIVERVIDLISLFICVLLATILEYERLGKFFSENIFDPLQNKFAGILASTLGISIIVIFIVLLIVILIYLARQRKKASKGSTISKLISGLMDGLRSIGNLKKPWQFIFHSIFIWLLYYFSVYLCFFALPSTSNLGLSAALFVLVAGGFGMSAPVQGGIGAYHLFVSQGLVLYGLSKQDGLTFATLVHSFQIIMVVIFGAASLLLLFLNNKDKQPVVETKN